jgi:HAD superfamily hydrolase (TIGR01509 family)
MKYKGVIFDFNGTIFWDTPLHNKAWDIFLKKFSLSLSDEKKNEVIHGRTTPDILKYLFDRKMSEEEIRSFRYEKEVVYQKLCVDNGLKLASGVVELLEFLKENNIAYTLATASSLNNVDFYFSYLNLDKYFDRNKVSYDDGTVKGKPSPDLFIRAFDKLSVEGKNAVIFEDSYAGIEAAQNSGAGFIYIVNSTRADYSRFSHNIISDFSEVDKNIFI